MAHLARLFSPGAIGGMELENRICMAPMGVAPGDADGFITDRAIDYYVERANGGAGLITIGAGNPIEEARAPRRAWIWDDKFIPRLRDLVNAVHENGAKIALQLMHHGIALAEPRNRLDPSTPRDLVAPSVTRVASTDSLPRELSVGETKQLVQDFAEGARRARDAGFDAVEFQGAHGYLIHSFFSPLTNRRNDEYGGAIENRARFACEILESTRKRLGPRFPIIMRISAHEYLEGGLVLEDVLRYAPLLVEAGADALDVSACAHESFARQIASYMYPEGLLVPLAAAVKKVVRVPVICVGRISDPTFAETVLEEGKADFVSLGRPLLADPHWPRKAREGRFDDIRPCIYCNNCMGYRVAGSLACTVNPALLREREFEIRPSPEPKRVMVAGGGLAGMEAARVLVARGHRVTLCEASPELGGQWRIACQQVEKAKCFASFAGYLILGLDRSGVEVKLNTRVTPQLVSQENPDAVVVATGASPAIPHVPGATGDNVVQAIDVIAGKAQVGETIVIIGGRERGMELADDLSKKGKKVFLATRSRLGRDVERSIYLTLRDRLLAQNVTVFEHASLLDIAPTGVRLAHNRELLFLRADTVVLAVGAKPENELVQQLQGVAREQYQVGDCVEPRNALMSIREAAEVARRI